MKREILFRGKLSHSDKWIEGNLLIANNDKPYIIPSAVLEPDGHHLRIDSDSAYWIIPETIGQFTGLTDKKGVKIFEGDVVRWSFGQHYWEAVISSIENNKSNTLYAIETFHNCTKDEEGYYTYERSDSRRGTRNDIEFMSKRIEVIGTIHDNPKLINK